MASLDINSAKAAIVASDETMRLQLLIFLLATVATASLGMSYAEAH